MSPGSRNEIDLEIARLRRRKPTLVLRSGILREFRACLMEKGYIEVETPQIVPQPAPERHIDPIHVENSYLHTSPEICMKRLFAAGYHQIFQICKCFRKSERGRRHLPEFTMLEWYRAGIDYKGLMEDCETLISEVVRRLRSDYRITYRDEEIDFSPPWQRMSVKEAFERYGGVNLEEVRAEGLFEEVLVRRVEPRLGLGRPTFLYDFPAPMAAMAKRKKDAPMIEERFEVYVAGMELANGFTELNDKEEQRRRLEDEMRVRREAGRSTFAMPERFLQAVGHMPDGAGIAVGIDRFVMVLAGKEDIKDVVTFTPEEL